VEIRGVGDGFGFGTGGAPDVLGRAGVEVGFFIDAGNAHIEGVAQQG
jgi:hypothetical protein